MEPSKAFRTRDLSASAIAVMAFAVTTLLITSGSVTEETLAASGILTEFHGIGGEALINFTKIGGMQNTDYSLKLPKQSNVIEAQMNMSGDDIFIGNQIKTYKSAYDFRTGTAHNLIFDTAGLHLDMDTLAPFWSGDKYSAGTNPYDIARGDFNNDNRDDFVVVNYDSDSATVFYQNAQGRMGTKSTHTTGDQPYTVTTGDFNKDGRDDFAVGCFGSKRIDFFYQGASGFTRSSVNLGYAIVGIATGDLNGDSLDDVAIATSEYQGLTYLQKLGGGFSSGSNLTVGEQGSWYWDTFSVTDVAVADFNRDGKDDVAWTMASGYRWNYDYSSYGKIKLYYQSATGTLNYRTMIYGWTGCWNIVAGDLNSDGRPDIAVSQAYVNKVKVFYQTASGWTGASNLGPDGRVHRLDIGDLDGDNKLDLVATSEKPTILFYKQSDGSISTQPKKFDLPSGAKGRGVAVGDFNGDSFLDAATADGSSNSASVFRQRLQYDGSYVSEPVERPLPIRFINFTYNLRSGGGHSEFFYSVNGGTEWLPIINGTTYDLVNRTDTIWYKVTFSATSASRYSSLKEFNINMTYQTWPSNIRVDLGRDGSVEWNMTGELQGEEQMTDFGDALTEYVQNQTHPADAEGYVTIPMEVYSKTPGTLMISNLYILYNNASRRPEIVKPRNNGFVNSTPTLEFFANDTDGDLLKYMVQITRTDFSDNFNTMTFDMRWNLYDDIEGEGFPKASFPESTVASFTLPEAFSLADDTNYKWRVLAFDGYLMSKPSPIYTMKVDSKPPSGHASSPRYSTDLAFTITWFAEDVVPGSGLAPAGTYDVQYRKSNELVWHNWLLFTTQTSAVFNGEEGVTYYFRMRARDAVWNEQLFIGGKGDTQTTVDTQRPTVTWADMPNFQDTRTFVVRWIGSDYVPGSGIRHFDVQVRKEQGSWTPWLTEFKSSQAVYTADSDRTYYFRARAMDQAGNLGDWSEEFSVRIDATAPVVLKEPAVPVEGDAWTNLTMLIVDFEFVDLESSVQRVEVGVGTAEGLYDVMAPTLFDYPASGRLVLEGLPLVNSLTYFVGVRAENQAAAWSDWAWTDGVLVAIPGPVSQMSFEQGTVTDPEIVIDISVSDPRAYEVTLGDLRMRYATVHDGVWEWSDWERISNAREEVSFEGKRGFRYQFRYRAQNELGSWGDFVEYPETYYVYVNNPPVANGGPDQMAKVDATVQFSADASEDRDGDPLTYSWDFGDGTVSNELFATHKYTKSGLYTVTLTVNDGYEESTARITVYVEVEQEAPGFGPFAALLALMIAGIGATYLSGTRKGR